MSTYGAAVVVGAVQAVYSVGGYSGGRLYDGSCTYAEGSGYRPSVAEVVGALYGPLEGFEAGELARLFDADVRGGVSGG